MTLVQIHCKVPSCRKLLEGVMTAPAATDELRWSSFVAVQICPKHGAGAGNGYIHAWQERQRRAGKPTDRVAVRTYIPWADLRPAVEKARLTGRPEEHRI